MPPHLFFTSFLGSHICAWFKSNLYTTAAQVKRLVGSNPCPCQPQASWMLTINPAFNHIFSQSSSWLPPCALPWSCQTRRPERGGGEIQVAGQQHLGQGSRYLYGARSLLRCSRTFPCMGLILGPLGTSCLLYGLPIPCVAQNVRFAPDAGWCVGCEKHQARIMSEVVRWRQTRDRSPCGAYALWVIGTGQVTRPDPAQDVLRPLAGLNMARLRLLKTHVGWLGEGGGGSERSGMGDEAWSRWFLVSLCHLFWF